MWHIRKTMAANGKLSDWNAQVEIVDKTENPGPWDELRIKFNYRNVKENMSGCFLELMSEVNDHLSHSPHNFSSNLRSNMDTGISWFAPKIVTALPLQSQVLVMFSQQEFL